jgi:ectoine hydroxylase-related dioxygenase (phytanoyl-CoA dioxygenase family)
MGLHATQLFQVGYTVLSRLIQPEEVDATTHQVDGVLAGGAGTRRLLHLSWCRQLAERLMADEQLREMGMDVAHLVQCTLFTKSTERNWLVPLHQDLSIPVAERLSGTQFSGWSEKEGEVFMQPPVKVLQKLLAVRVHLDDSDGRNGALRVVPGSHQLGRLTATEAITARETMGEVVVSVPRGGAMVLRPLLLHASSKSAINSPRRVLHFVFGPRDLPESLRWPCREQSLATGG